MKSAYARDLDLNLLRVLVTVADAGSVTEAASRLYLTQPAISAALRRLTNTLGEPLFARRGRGLALTERGARLVREVRPHLQAMTDAALTPERFDPKTSERTFRVGLADSTETWLLGPLLRTLERDAPRMRIISLPVQFRTVGEALATRRVDFAVTVADDLPPSIRRAPLFEGGFVCLYDPRHGRLGPRPTEREYFDREHVIVSDNGDLRGVVEDAFEKQRKIRCSVGSFSSIGPIVDGSSLVATVPTVVAVPILRLHPKLRTAIPPFRFPETGMELLFPAALEGDRAFEFLRGVVARIAEDARRAVKGARPRAIRSAGG
ncbi:MAG TPA: LysR family transcriptional regulator [Polyangiaceae bacterium]|nr:LysR family transcriptional regulator [Polyangiaceae bacterium]